MTKRRMRLSEDDLKVVLRMRGLKNNPYRIVNSDSTYRLTLTREEEDEVAINRALTVLDNPSIICDIVRKSLGYIVDDYDVTVIIRNKVTNEIKQATIGTRP